MLFGKPLDEDKVAADALRNLMIVESVFGEKPQLFVATAPQNTVKAKEKALAEKREEMSRVSDENMRLLNKVLTLRFNGSERARIINDVSSHKLTDYQTRRYLLLLESVADLGNASGVFADPTFFNLVKGLKHGIKASPDSDLLGDRERHTAWSDSTDLSADKLRVRFGLRLHIIAKTTYSEPLAYLYRDNVKEIGLVLRDRSLESLLLNRPDRMEDIYDLLMVNYRTTGNRIGGILLTEDRLIKGR
jgi:hypothetical protein